MSHDRNPEEIQTQAHRKGVQVERLDRYDRIDEEWQQALVEDRRCGPAEIAAAKIDITDWFRKLPSRDQRIARELATTTRRESRVLKRPRHAIIRDIQWLHEQRYMRKGYQRWMCKMQA